jgi:putative ABC transport system permease protein
VTNGTWAWLRERAVRLWATFGRTRPDRDLERELQSHLELAADDAQRRGAPPQQAARTVRLRAGAVSQAMDALRDQGRVPWLDALRSDVVFGWRQLNKHRAASSAAVLSLGLAIGATTAAFRLVDAVLLRPLPVAEPDRLFVVTTTFVDADKRPDDRDDFDYPTYRDFLRAAGERADLMVIGLAARQPALFGTPQDEPETVIRQFLSGNVFGTFGLQPAAGRLLTPADDTTPGAHPVAVLSHDYWTRRFNRDPGIVGRTFRWGSRPLEVVGVAPEGFTGTEPGTVTDLFLPAMMNAEAIDSPGWSWFRIWVRPKPGISAEQVRQVLQARYRSGQERRVQSLPADTPKERIDAFLDEDVRLVPAGAGISALQKTFRRPLLIVTALAAIVLLVACVNVANLLTAQAIARTREMALRIAIGAGRWRLIQLVLIESALLAVLASAAGAMLASWSAPLIVSMLAPIERPIRVILDVDWRVIGFGVILTLAVASLFGVAPALRASAVEPLGALKGASDPHAHSRLMTWSIAGQIAFCVFLLFAAGLFIGTFDRLLNQPLGFTHRNVILLQIESRARQPAGVWTAVTDHLRQVPGVEAAAFAGWAPLSGNRWRAAVRVDGGRFEGSSPYFLEVAPAYFDTLRIDIVRGRDFRAGDPQSRLGPQQQPLAGLGIGNEAFARRYFNGADPVGKHVNVRQDKDVETPMEIIGLVRDAAYFSVREPMQPTVYVPAEVRNNGAILVRTSGDPTALAATLRREVSRVRSDLRVRAAEPLSAFVRQQMIRERLLATLSSFFGFVALLLAGIGLYGVLNYAVVRQWREIGIRLALGARASHLVKRVTVRMLIVVGAGAFVGLGAGVAVGPVVQALLFHVTPTDPLSLIAPILALAIVSAVAALPPAIRAVRIDPVTTLRTE